MKEKKKILQIGIDLDNTLIDSNIVETIFTKYHLPVVYPTDWAMSNLPSDIRKEIREHFVDPECKLMTTYKPYDGVIFKMVEWLAYGHEIHIITARVQESITRKYIKSLFPFIFDQNIAVVGIGGCKAKEIKKRNLDIMIDDMFHDPILEINGLKKILISNETTPYNYYLRKEVDLVVEKLIDIRI